MVKPRISVIIGIYNCASTLSEALDSLYAQTYQGFKIILCDDGSTDNTYQVASDYAKTHDNIILLRNEKNMDSYKLIVICIWLHYSQINIVTFYLSACISLY